MSDPLDLLRLILDVATNDPQSVILMLALGLLASIGLHIIAGVGRNAGYSFAKEERVRKHARRELLVVCGLALLTALAAWVALRL